MMISIRTSVFLFAFAMHLHGSQALRHKTGTQVSAENVGMVPVLEAEESIAAKIKEQLRTEIEYLVHSDFTINAWSGEDSEYYCFPDGILHVQHNEDMRPQIILRSSSVSVKYLFNTNVLLKPTLFGSISGGVSCQVVGPDAVQYTTCKSDIKLSVQPTDNDRFKGFQLDPIVFHHVDITSNSVLGHNSSDHYDEITMYVEQKQGLLATALEKGFSTKSAPADFVLKVQSRNSFTVGTDTQPKQMKGIHLNHLNLCLMLDFWTNAYSSASELYQLCPTTFIQLTNESSVEEYFVAFPEGKDLLWQLCIVGAPSILPDLGFKICDHMLRRELTHKIIWQGSSLLKHLFFNGPTRTLRMYLGDKRGDKAKRVMGIAPDGENLEVTVCREDVVACNEARWKLDGRIDTLLAGLDFHHVGQGRRLQLLADTDIVDADGRTFFATRPALSAQPSEGLEDNLQDQETEIEPIEASEPASLTMASAPVQLWMDPGEIQTRPRRDAIQG